MNHSVKRRRQALHQTHHHYYLNISVEAANLSDWRIESNQNFFARIGMIYRTAVDRYLLAGGPAPRRVAGEWNRQTDGRTFESRIDPVPLTTPAVSVARPKNSEISKHAHV